jgi:hypothetical protein
MVMLLMDFLALWDNIYDYVFTALDFLVILYGWSYSYQIKDVENISSPTERRCLVLQITEIPGSNLCWISIVLAEGFRNSLIPSITTTSSAPFVIHNNCHSKMYLWYLARRAYVNTNYFALSPYQGTLKIVH